MRRRSHRLRALLRRREVPEPARLCVQRRGHEGTRGSAISTSRDAESVHTLASEGQPPGLGEADALFKLSGRRGPVLAARANMTTARWGPQRQQGGGRGVGRPPGDAEPPPETLGAAPRAEELCSRALDGLRAGQSQTCLLTATQLPPTRPSGCPRPLPLTGSGVTLTPPPPLSTLGASLTPAPRSLPEPSSEWAARGGFVILPPALRPRPTVPAWWSSAMPHLPSHAGPWSSEGNTPSPGHSLQAAPHSLLSGGWASARSPSLMGNLLCLYNPDL